MVAPAAALVYFVFWVASAWGRGGVADNTVVFGLFAVAVALAYWIPTTSLALVVVVPVLQLLGLAEAPSQNTWMAYVAIALVMFFVALKPSPWLRLVALVVAAVAAGLAAWLLAVPTLTRPQSWSTWVGAGTTGLRIEFSLLTAALFGVFAGAWAIGVAFASIRRVLVIRQALEATETRFEAADLELRLAQDRARISRDVHDALAHSLAVVVSQAQGGLALQATRPEVAEESLRTIADVGRTALLDVRRLVERITQDDDVTAPRETLADVAGLVTAMREVGMEVEVAVEGASEPQGPPGALAPSQELAVYRIVQESLTNALKHAGTSSRVAVRLDWRGRGLTLQVTSRGRGAPLVAARTGADRGAGVRGMTERARLAGGWLTAQPSADGTSFEVTAFVPTAGGSAVGGSAVSGSAVGGDASSDSGVASAAPASLGATAASSSGASSTAASIAGVTAASSSASTERSPS